MFGCSDALNFFHFENISSISLGSVGLDSRGHRISLNFDGFTWFEMDLHRFRWILMDLSRFIWIYVNFDRFYCIYLDLYRFH